VYTRLSTSRVLVTEWFDGVSMRDASTLIARLGLDRLTLARELLDTLASQIVLSGTFHADPHPGNVMLLSDGQMGLLDFGSVGRIDPMQQGALRNVLLAMQRRDAAELRVALRELIEPAPDINDERLERALGRLIARYLAPGATLGAELIGEGFQLLREFGIGFPPEIAAVFRALVTLDGTLQVIAPDFPIVDEARELGARWVRDALMPASLGRTVLDELRAMLPMLRRLPRRLDRIGEALEHGSLTVNVRLFSDARDERVISSLAGRAILGFLGAAVGIMSVLLLSVQTGPMLFATITIFQLLGYLGLCASIALILRVVVAIVRDRQV
jgi:ubiquinone biosynthesis protein